MTEHLTELEIYELASGEDVEARVAEHAEACAACAAEVSSARRVLAAVEGLDAAVDPPAGLARKLDAMPLPPRSASTPRGAGSRAPWLRAAAAVVLFGAGAAAHAAWIDSRDARSPDLPAPVPPVLAAQQAGTEYVAAIARLVADSSRLSERERSLGREVGLAAMVGAAYELRLLSPGETADQIHRLIETTWTREPAP